MISSRLQEAISSIDGIQTQTQTRLAPFTTYRIGGPVAILAQVSTRRGLRAILDMLAEAQVPWVVIGNGSNLLVADKGFDGVVLRLGGDFDTAKVQHAHYGPDEHLLEAGAALSITRLLRMAKERDIAGVECLGGVPGTVGGAVRMNAGTTMGELSDCLVEAEFLQAHKESFWLAAETLGFAYRRSELPPLSVVIGARFRTTTGGDEMRERLAQVLAYRKQTQPLQLPSCGSVFTNPAGDHAGRLIEQAGLKGRRIGDAAISDLHANWIVNVGSATAEDVRTLMDLCISEVERQSKVRLRQEVHFIGDWQWEGETCG